MCSLFLFKKHHLLINTFLIIAAAGAASPLSAKVTQTQHEMMWHKIRTLPEAKRTVGFLPMKSIFQIYQATGKVETNRWYLEGKTLNRKLSVDDKVHAKQPVLPVFFFFFFWCLFCCVFAQFSYCWHQKG